MLLSTHFESLSGVRYAKFYVAIWLYIMLLTSLISLFHKFYIKNPGYGRQRISQLMRIGAPLPFFSLPPLPPPPKGREGGGGGGKEG